MVKKSSKSNGFFAIMMVCMMLSAAVIPVTLATNTDHIKGFDKGPSYKSVVPMKKVTFVDFDEDSCLDDYAYLAAVPTAVFNDGDKLFSNPLLFYQDSYPVKEDKERSLNARQGIDYFMEDWMSYCNGKADRMILINIDEKDIPEEWGAEEYVTIKGTDPYVIAKDIALQDWSFSDNAVVAVINDDFKESNLEISNKINEKLDNAKVKSERFVFDQVDPITPKYLDLNVPEGYQYLKANLWYSCFYVKPPWPAGLPPVNITIPPGDPNIELFCTYNGELMQVAATFGWNAIYGMSIEKTASYIYEAGPWKVAVTDVPTHSGETTIDTKQVHRSIFGFEFGRYGSIFDVLKNIRDLKYNVDVEMYPGKLIDLEDNPLFGCKNATFKLTWNDPDITLGFSLIGPGGEEVLSSFEEDAESQVMYLEQLGECKENENYKVSVFTMQDIDSPVDFQLEYSFKQGLTEEKADSLTSATEASVLASIYNAPLLYVKPSSLPESTKDVLYKLGVETITIVDIGGHLNSDTKEAIKDIANVKIHYKELKPLYDEIRKHTNSNDIIFSTLDPWTWWLVENRRPEGEYPGALFIGPAAYIAAHHGSPVLLVDMHPELSSSVVWHTEAWKRNERRSGGVAALPSVAEMYLTAKRTFNFLGELGFDQEGRETMITVAGKFDIGTPWDRAFLGVANPGRFFGSPVDTAYWISRNMFYPALIFENPATNPNGVELIDGSKSERRFPYWTKLGLNIYKESKSDVFTNPVLNTYLTYTHRFNERASDYWGWKYVCADGMIPGESSTFAPIDDGVTKKYTGEGGSKFPDFSQSEVIPFYLDRGEYENVFSTSFDAVMNNLNTGVLLWMGSAHGSAGDSGTLDFWNPDGKVIYEENPWRGYEWYLGSTDEPDTLTMDVNGIIPMLWGNPTGRGLTGKGLLRTSIDIGLAKKPILDGVGKIAGMPGISYFAPDWLENSNDYYDGVISSVLLFKAGVKLYDGYQFDEAMDNIHSVGIVNGACLLANKYLHLSFIRHGSVFQILDPWPTSWYTTWTQFVPRNLVLGDTIGDAFVEGISHVGILYITDPPQWWADSKQNVCFFGDPALHPYVPGTDYSTNNNWDVTETLPLKYQKDTNIAGHMPYGATSYPHEKEPLTFLQQYLVLITSIAAIVLLVIVAVYLQRRKK